VNAPLAEQAQDFASLLRLEPLGAGRFRSICSDLDYQGGHMFGGQLVAQALAAALPSFGGKRVHSLHGYFLRPGDVRHAIDYLVEDLRDGRSFATRRVRAEQHGKLLYEMLCSASTGEPGPMDHQDASPGDVPPPGGLATMAQLLEDPDFADCHDTIARLTPMDLVDCRPLEPERVFRPGGGGPVRVWLRVPSLAGSLDPALQACMVAYLQDYVIAFVPWTYQPKVFALDSPSVASLDSNVWFHWPAPADWLLFDMASPLGAGSTALATGRLIDQAGRVIASATQEVLFRELKG
jgi:acyl-CoA thioesterase-2